MTSDDNKEDFKAVIEQNYERVYNVIYRMISDPEQAADLTQETFVNAYRSWDSFRGDSQVYTWLYRIAVNLTKNRLERQGRVNRTEAFSIDAPIDTDGDSELYMQINDESMAPENLVDNQELKKVLVEQVDRLRHDYKEVIILRDYQGFSYNEIADILGCSLQAVKSRLFRARSTLRQRLQSYLKDKV
ncbi:MAG: sigma-70 family RNA polymerase sigma factor [Armatimonadota bacterium]